MSIRNDDAMFGRLMSRREALSMLGVASSQLVFGSSPAYAQSRPDCIAIPQQTEGPFFVDTKLARSDIRSDSVTGALRAGVPLRLTLQASRLGNKGCVPLTDAHVELWQCDAHGIYSGVRDSSADSRGQNFLRGYQATDADGIVRFTTIYPGWYSGRTVHLHFMVLTGRASSRRSQFTSQLYFDDALSDKILARVPYNERGARTVRNNGDGIFRRGGSQLLLNVHGGAEELAATFHIALKDAT